MEQFGGSAAVAVRPSSLISTHPRPSAQRVIPIDTQPQTEIEVKLDELDHWLEFMSGLPGTSEVAPWLVAFRALRTERNVARDLAEQYRQERGKA